MPEKDDREPQTQKSNEKTKKEPKLEPDKNVESPEYDHVPAIRIRKEKKR